MIDREEAIARVEDELARHWHPGDVEEVVSHVGEYAECWAITCTSKAYVRSGDLSDLLIGRGPFLVDRATGEVHETGSGRSEEQSVEAFRQWGHPYGPALPEKPHHESASDTEPAG